jgi:hypothetical protein
MISSDARLLRRLASTIAAAARCGGDSVQIAGKIRISAVLSLHTPRLNPVARRTTAMIFPVITVSLQCVCFLQCPTREGGTCDDERIHLPDLRLAELAVRRCAPLPLPLYS